MTLHSHDIAAALAIDTRSVDALRAQAQQDPQRALKTAARQFEALFLNMLLKSMREASPRNGLFDNEQTRLYSALLDQQVAQILSAQGIGLADIMMRQLTRGTAAESSRTPPAAAASVPRLPGAVETAPAPSEEAAPGSDLSAVIHEFMAENWPHPPAVSEGAASGGNMKASPASPVAAAPAAPSSAPGARLSAAIRDFMATHWPHARAASEATGIPPQFLLAQAALESGWGRHEIRSADGAPSYNLFGIKAGRNWSGPVAESVTTEYAGGTPYRTSERFRAYGSYAESFRDYANLLASNPRYARVRGQQDAAGFAHGLQRAGYATDPNYADKLLRILHGIEARQGVVG